MALTLTDIKSLEEKSDIEANILHLENASRGWFEDEKDFLLKCKIEEKEAKLRYNTKLKAQANKKSGGSGSSGILNSNSRGTQKSGPMSGSTSSSIGGWSNIGVKKAPAPGAAVKKTTSSGFAAAFGDSDSD